MSRPDRQPRRLTWMTLALRAAAVSVVAAAAAAGAARAEVVDASSTTLLSGRADPRDGVVHTAVPVFELVSVRATDFHLPGVDDMTVILSGWEAAELGDAEEGKRSLGDLDIA